MGTVVGNLSVYDPDNLHLPLQKFVCSVVDGGPFKVCMQQTQRRVFSQCLIINLVSKGLEIKRVLGTNLPACRLVVVVNNMEK